MDCIRHYSDGATTLTNFWHKNVLDNVVHTKVTKAAVTFLKARIIPVLVLLFSKSNNMAECVVAIDAKEDRSKHKKRHANWTPT